MRTRLHAAIEASHAATVPPVGTPDPLGANPGVGDVALTLAAEETDPGRGGHLASLVVRHEAEVTRQSVNVPQDAGPFSRDPWAEVRRTLGVRR